MVIHPAWQCKDMLMCTGRLSRWSSILRVNTELQNIVSLVRRSSYPPLIFQLDVPLVLGGWLFGIGWGVAGLCPGPAVVAATFGLPGPALAFMPSLVLGMKVRASFWLRC